MNNKLLNFHYFPGGSYPGLIELRRFSVSRSNTITTSSNVTKTDGEVVYGRPTSDKRPVSPTLKCYSYTRTQIKADVGKVTILINNAGIVTGKKLLDSPDAMMLKTMEVNVIAHFWVRNFAFPLFPVVWQVLNRPNPSIKSIIGPTWYGSNL